MHASAHHCPSLARPPAARISGSRRTFNGRVARCLVRSRGWLTAVCLLALSAATSCAQTVWIDPNGGSYNDAANWSPANVPNTSSELALFNLDASYVVDFPTDVTAFLATITDGLVDWDLGSGGTERTYTLVNSLTVNPGSAGGEPVLIVLNGNIVVPNIQVSRGGRLEQSNATINFDNGTATVSDAGSRWDVDNVIFVGDSSTATLTIENGGNATCRSAFIANSPGSNGSVIVTGANSRWSRPNQSFHLTVGFLGSGSLLIEDGAWVLDSSAVIADFIGSTGVATVTGNGSSWRHNDDLTVGRVGNGSLSIEHGASVLCDDGFIGRSNQSIGTATITGIGSNWTQNFELCVGDRGKGRMTISAGASVSSSTCIIGKITNSDGTVTVTGTGSSWNAISNLQIGSGGNGSLTIDDGASVENEDGIIGFVNDAVGMATVSGVGSIWSNTRALNVGDSGNGSLQIEHGASVVSTTGVVARAPGSQGSVVVTGAGSVWAVANQIGIGGDPSTGQDGGSGTVSISTDGALTAAEHVVVFPDGLITLAEGTLVAGAIDLRNGGHFDFESGTLTAGTIKLEDTGSLDLKSGTIHVDLFEGDLTNEGGTLAPGRSSGSTIILGDLTQNTGAALEIEIGGTLVISRYDYVDVSGTAQLGGELHLLLIDGFTPNPADQFLILDSGNLVDFFSNARHGQRVTTLDGIGSFLVHYGAGSTFNSNQVVLTDFRLGENPPVILRQVANHTTTAGSEVVLGIEAVSREPVTYQWHRDSVVIAGATTATYTLPSVQAFHTGDYTVEVTNPFGQTTSETAVLEVVPPPPSDARLLNLSTRAQTLTGDDVLIPGFVIDGAASKRILARVVGPTLADFGVAGALADPVMTLKQRVGASSVDLAINDDWGANANAAEIVTTSALAGAFALNEASKDSALLLDLQPGQYTIVAEGKDAGTGVAIVELYDVDGDGSGSRLINISTRGFVGEGDLAMIPGFVISEEGPRTVLVRAVGPTLASLGVTGTMADPKLTVVRNNPDGSSTELFSQDNWGDSADAANTEATAALVGAFALDPDSADAAFVLTLAPGVYTIIGASADGSGTGIVLTEVYVVP